MTDSKDDIKAMMGANHEKDERWTRADELISEDHHLLGSFHSGVDVFMDLELF
jgi:hypothetical protein